MKLTFRDRRNNSLRTTLLEGNSLNCHIQHPRHIVGQDGRPEIENLSAISISVVRAIQLGTKVLFRWIIPILGIFFWRRT